MVGAVTDPLVLLNPAEAVVDVDGATPWRDGELLPTTIATTAMATTASKATEPSAILVRLLSRLTGGSARGGGR